MRLEVQRALDLAQVELAFVARLLEHIFRFENGWLLAMTVKVTPPYLWSHDYTNAAPYVIKPQPATVIFNP